MCEIVTQEMKDKITMLFEQSSETIIEYSEWVDELRAEISRLKSERKKAVEDLEKAIKFYALGECICTLCKTVKCKDFCFGKQWKWRGLEETK